MPKKKLTDAAVKTLPVPERGRIEYFDAHDNAPKGFALRVTAKGSRSWVLLFRSGRTLRRLTIGSYPTFSLKEAREEARKARQIIDRGDDPAALKAEKKVDARNPTTVKAVVADFIEKYHRRHRKNRTAEEIRRMFDRHVLPVWGSRDIKSIRKADIIRLIDTVSEKASPTRANRVLANVRKFFSWAAERDLVPASPVTGVKNPGKETERDRVLTDDEVRAVWKAAGELGYPFGTFTRMLLLCAQRRDEVARMRWDDVNEDGTWTLPRELTKADRSHEVPLPPMAIDILKGISETGRLGPYVFMSGRKSRSHGDEKRPISGFGRAKERLDSLSGVTGWRFHDLRRTAGTNMAKLEIPVSTISRVLNHAEGGVTKIYARHSYLEEKRRALAAWAERLATIIDPEKDVENIIRPGVWGR